MDSEITVVIPSYNPGEFLIKALQSVYDQTYLNWRLILVDDCSTDNSLEMAKDLLDNPRIKVIKNSVNLGTAKTMNVALKSITTSCFVQLDSDDWFTEDALETLLNEFKNQPEDVAVISGNIEVVDNQDNMKVHNNVVRGKLYKDKYDFLLADTAVWPRCYRTEIVKSIGGWPADDPYEGRYIEDKEILYRLIEKYKFCWIDKVLYFYRRHKNNSTNSNVEFFNEALEWTVKNNLKRWGNQYSAVFKTAANGWKYVESLIKN